MCVFWTTCIIIWFFSFFKDINDFVSQSGWFSYPGLAHGKAALEHVLAKKSKLTREQFLNIQEAVYLFNYRNGEKVKTTTVYLRISLVATYICTRCACCFVIWLANTYTYYHCDNLFHKVDTKVSSVCMVRIYFCHFWISYWMGFDINPLGPRTTKVVNVSRVLRGLAPLLTLLSPPRTSPKLHHFRSAFLE